MDVELSQESLAILTAEAEYLNQPLPDLLRDIIADKARRLFYVQRSRKRKQPKPAGWQQAAKLGNQLLAIYNNPKVQARLGVGLAIMQISFIKTLMDAGDTAALEEIRTLQPWTKKGS